MDNLCSKFEQFCNFGVGSKEKKTTMTDKACTKCFKDAKLYGKKLTTTDTDIAFSKVKEKGKKEITLAQFKTLLAEVAPKYKEQQKLGSNEEAVEQMASKIAGGGPSTAGTTGISKTGGVAKMTDASQYTGAHKERFNADGTGKGIDGREERAANDGYVGNYKGKDTFEDKK